MKILNYLFLWFVKITGAPPAWIFLRRKTHYTNKAVQSRRLRGPAILMSNHKSLMDFVLYLTVFPWRTLHFLMAEVLYNKGPVFAWFLNRLGGIRVDRNAFDFRFIKQSVDILNQGGVVGVFPEGQLPRNGELGAFRPSIVSIALASGAPIIPMYTDGAYSMKHRTHVIIGEPIELKAHCNEEHPSRETIDRLNTMLREEIIRLGRQLELEKQQH